MDTRTRKVLIADDEPDIIEILKYNLIKEGYQVVTAIDGNDALAKAQQTNPDLIVLDMMMPGKSGMEVCEILRSQPQFKETLIMFLTALSDEATQIKGLSTGADDYVSKPVSPNIFITKVQSLLRRAKKEETKEVSINGLTIDPESFLVVYNEEEFSLAKKEFE
ncbi:MAG TPA: response regulator transcription factor, partial [Flavisolibacter sp.]|nr:response regulator transcription factor [Flavisolibacter sp.]